MGMLRQLQADFVALGELAEKIWVFTRQNSGQPMAHELQNEITLSRALKLVLRPGARRGSTRPEGMFGKHGLGASGEFVCQSLSHLMGEGAAGG